MGQIILWEQEVQLLDFRLTPTNNKVGGVMAWLHLTIIVPSLSLDL